MIMTVGVRGWEEDSGGGAGVGRLEESTGGGEEVCTGVEESILGVEEERERCVEVTKGARY